MGSPRGVDVRSRNSGGTRPDPRVGRLLEPRVAFFPASGENMTPRDFGVEYEPLTLATRDGEHLRAWAISSRNIRARILYCHGNGGNLSLWAPIVTAIAGHGYAVTAFDYRGYGVSIGRPTERGLYHDVEAAVERFWHDTPNDVPIVYWGRSLAVAMASFAATVREPDGLILESGFPDARSLMRDSLWFWLLAHMRFVTIRRGDHNDVAQPDPVAYWGAVSEFIDSLGMRSMRGGQAWQSGLRRLTVRLIDRFT